MYRRKRAILGIDANSKGLLLLDSAPQHTSKVFLQVRKRWADELNVIVIGDGSIDDVTVPQGIGATIAPNDGWHQFAHQCRRALDRVAIHWQRNLLVRKRLDELNIDAQGSSSVEMQNVRSVLNDIASMQIIREYETTPPDAHGVSGSKIIMWSWMSRGWITPEEMASFYYGGDTDALGVHMERLRGALSKMLDLEERSAVRKSLHQHTSFPCYLVLCCIGRVCKYTYEFAYALNGSMSKNTWG